MFEGYEFTFAGRSCREFGLMLYDIDGRGQEDVAFGNKGSIVETRTNRRVKPIHFGVSYHREPLQFKLVFGAERPLDRFEMEEVALWLTGRQEYQWLTVEQPDMEEVQYRCLITSLTPISVGWLPYAFEAEVTCDCPYAYGPPVEESFQIRGETRLLIRDGGSVWETVRPAMVFVPESGTESLSIVNEDDGGREFRLDGIPAGARVAVDGDSGIIEDTAGGANLYGGFNLSFLRLVHGDNHLTVRGDGALTLSWRPYRNTAG